MDFQLWVTFNLVLTVTMGGLGSFRGSIVAAAAFILLRDGFRFLPLPASGQGALQQLLFGVLLIIIMLRFPQGLLPETPTVTLSETKRHQSKQA
jgi:branched-chain amino acid transport system permease protein